MRKLLGFKIIEPGQTNPHKGIIYKVLCLSKIFIPTEGNGKGVHMVTQLSSERKIVLSRYVYFLDVFHWGIAGKYWLCSQFLCVDCSYLFTRKSIMFSSGLFCFSAEQTLKQPFSCKNLFAYTMCAIQSQHYRQSRCLCFPSYVPWEVVEFFLKMLALLIKTAVYCSSLRTPSVVTDIFSLSCIESLDRFLLLNVHSKMLPSNLQTKNYSQQLSTE